MPRSTARSRNCGRTGNRTAGGTEGTDRRDREQTRNGERGGGRGRGGQRGAEEKNQPLVGNATEYRGFYGGGSADYIQHLQHQERAQRMTGVGTLGNGPGQHGPGNLPGDKMHRRNLNPRVVRILRRRYGRAKPTPRQSGRILPSVTTFCG